MAKEKTARAVERCYGWAAENAWCFRRKGWPRPLRPSHQTPRRRQVSRSARRHKGWMPSLSFGQRGKIGRVASPARNCLSQMNCVLLAARKVVPLAAGAGELVGGSMARARRRRRNQRDHPEGENDNATIAIICRCSALQLGPRQFPARPLPVISPVYPYLPFRVPNSIFTRLSAEHRGWVERRT